MPTAKLIYHTPLQIAIDAMNNCYGCKCSTKSLVKAVTAGHLSLLEHVNATFDIMCSEAVLKQISRHRHLSPTVESSRGSDITANGFYIPKELNDMKENDIPVIESLFRINEAVKGFYKRLIELGVSKETAAYILPMATQVKMRYTGNLRAWFEYLQKRLCKRASAEHQELAHAIYDELKLVYPDIFNDELMNICKNCKEKSCKF